MSIIIRRTVLSVSFVILILPSAARAQGLSGSRSTWHQSAAAVTQPHDSVWDGALIGAGVGAIAGMVVAPRATCGKNDPECAAIVRVAIGLPSIAAGAGIGALIDALSYSRRAGQLRRIDIDPVLSRRVTAIQVRLRLDRRGSSRSPR